VGLDPLLYPSPKEDWQKLHNKAVLHPEGFHEQAIVAMLVGWIGYSRAYYDKFGFEIGSNPLVGRSWAKVGYEYKLLISCNETGRLDRGWLEKVINKRLRSEGFCENSDPY
jgi:hypothetical protein